MGARSGGFATLTAVLLLSACGSSHADEDRRLSRTATRIHADEGTVRYRHVSDHGVFGQGRLLSVVTLRHGPRDQVLREQLDAIVAAGYEPTPSEQCLTSEADQCVFSRPAGLPYVSVAAVGGGTALSYEDGRTTRTLWVPEGSTGVRIVLTDETTAEH